MPVPVFTFAAWSNTGKTTYLEKLIPLLKRAGLRVAVVKHDAHDFQLDQPGKDTWRFARAGADVVAIASGSRYAMMACRPVTLEEILRQTRDADLVLTEGFKQEHCPKIALYRAASGKGLAVPPEACFAIVSDTAMEAPCPVFPLDGYALRAADSAGACRERPVSLWVVGKLYAGQESRVSLAPGQAVRLMTGSMIPSGADCVLRQEDTDEGEDVVQIYQELRPYSNFCRRGEEYGAGGLLLPAGCVVDPTGAAVAAGAGFADLPVRRRLRAAVVSTGDEVQQPGRPLRPGKIYDSNTTYLSARLRQLGVDVVRRASVPDDLDRTVAELARCAGMADLILTTGGVSVGQKDLLEAAARKFGAEIVFHGISMKPGMPTLLAVRGRTLLLGLSGNPFSAAVPFELLLRPALHKMTGDPRHQLRRAAARAENGFSRRSPSRRFLRGVCRDGAVSLPGAQSNGQMRSMIGCNCFVDLPAGTERIRPGDSVEIIWL